MSKNGVKKGIFFTCLTLSLCFGGSGAFAYASAENTTQTDELLAPSSYEQYLDLDAPTDIAVSENFTAIADKNIVYLYDREDGVYRQYTHNFYPSNPSSNNLSKLQFDADGNLYFLDQHELFILPFEQLDNPSVATETGFSCTTFLVVGDTLYFTDAKAGNTQLLETTIDGVTPDKQNRKTIVESGLTGIPSLAFWNDELYFTNKGLTSTLYKFNPSAETERPIAGFKEKQIASFDADVTSIAVTGDTLTLCTNAKTFYAYALPRADEDAMLKMQTGEFTALSCYDGFAYAVNGKSVWQYDVEKNAFTDFEICANSSRDNRLNGATDILQVSEKLFIADGGNARISVFDTANQTLSSAFNVSLPATYLASSEKILVVANQTQVALYSINDVDYGTQLALFENFADAVVGVASVYGTHYVATANTAYQIAYNDAIQAYEMTATEKTSFHPTLLSADVYGNLYTMKNGLVYRFTEEEFISPDGVGTRLTTTPLTGVKKLVFDYEGDGYALKENTVQKLTENGEHYLFDTPLVYKTQTQATAFTFGVEENAGYLLMDGNHLVKTERFNLPTVKTIETQNADEQIFSAQSVEVEVVSVQQNALLIAFSLDTLDGTQHLPYVAYGRSNATRTALKLGETDGYYLIAVFDENANDYFTYAVKKQFCQKLEKTEYLVSYQTGKTAWLTNGIHLYKFPYLNGLLTVNDLERGKQITLLGEINELDHDYYLIEVTAENGEKTQGYIPKAYASLINAAPTKPSQTLVGATEGDRDAVTRLVYLVLGFAIVCILTDFLLLRKKEEDDE